MSRTIELPYAQGSDAWLRARRSRYGASEIGALAGVCPYAGPVDVWRAKRDLPRERTGGDLHLRIGHLLEPLTRELWTEETGRALSQGPVLAEERGWLLSSLDHEVPDSWEPVDGKVRTEGSEDWRLWVDGLIPEHVALQLTQQAKLSERYRGVKIGAAHVAVITISRFGFRFSASRLPLTAEIRDLHAEIAATIPAWHAAYVLGDAYPEGADWRDVARGVRVDTVTERPATDAEIEALVRWREAEARAAALRAEVRAAEAERDAAKDLIATSVGPTATIPGVRWASNKARGPQLKLTKE